MILCGGLATRFLPITKTIPKEMLPILNRPALDYCIRELKENGITDILIVLGRGKECLENYYDRNIELEDRLIAGNKTKELELISEPYTGVNISFLRQISAKGTGYAVSRAKSFMGNDPFVLVFPDELTVGGDKTKQLIDTYNKTGGSIIPLCRIDIKDSYKYGMVSFEEENDCIKLTGIVEKPAPENSPSDMCNLGGGIFTSDIFKYLEDCKEQPNGEIYLTDAYEGLIKDGNLYGKIIEGNRLDFGSPLGFVKGNVIAGLNDPETSESIKEFILELAEELKK